MDVVGACHRTAHAKKRPRLVTTKQAQAGTTATIISSLQSDVVSYLEHGVLVAEFTICGKQVHATGYAASFVQGRQ